MFAVREMGKLSGVKLTNSDSEFGLTIRVLHWLIALAVPLQFAGGVTDVEDELHASFGLLILGS
jgi:cytochrome b561